MKVVLNNLLTKSNQTSMMRTYLSVWRQFNKFIISLDLKPMSWEDRTSLFIAHMIDRGLQSCSVRSYVSAIKRILVDDGYCWNDQKVLLTSLTRACRLVNDRVHTRLGIQIGLLELILFEVHKMYGNDGQVYLSTMYKSLLILGYYGLLRAGELTQSPHVIKAVNIHLAANKQKILVVLYSSKMHSEALRPQKIKITAMQSCRCNLKRNFCPFRLLREYMQLWGDYEDSNEQFFYFQ